MFKIDQFILNSAVQVASCLTHSAGNLDQVVDLRRVLKLFREHSYAIRYQVVHWVSFSLEFIALILIAMSYGATPGY